MSWNWNHRPYVSAGERRAKATKHAKKLAKTGEKLSPVTIDGRMIARSFWGKAWCDHLELLGDYANRLPRGRTYVRNGSVLDLQITSGKIKTRVMGSTLYHGAIAVAPLKAERWKTIKAACAGKIDSLVGLLQGRLSEPVMRIITDQEKGLFPKPSEIKLECSCPDSAGLCKHLAAVLYGVGARLDQQPELLFVLRGVDHLELIDAAADVSTLAPAENGTPSLDPTHLSDIFGIEIAPMATPTIGAAPVSPLNVPTAKPKLSVAAKKRKPAVLRSKTPKPEITKAISRRSAKKRPTS